MSRKTQDPEAKQTECESLVVQINVYIETIKPRPLLTP